MDKQFVIGDKVSVVNVVTNKRVNGSILAINNGVAWVDNSGLVGVNELKPVYVPSEREIFIERALKILKLENYNHISIGELFDAGCRFVDTHK